MKYNPKIHKRKSIRLKGYDYSQQGMYFVTVCTHEKKCNLGKVINDKMQLNKYGYIVETELLKSNNLRKEICLDKCVVMPNHLHIIVQIVGANGRSPLQKHPTFRMKPKSLSSFMAGFKSTVTKQINIIRKTPGIPFWQRNYYEHVIRNEKELNRIRGYIINNPLKWLLDRENPDRKGSDKLEDEIFGKSCRGERPLAPTFHIIN